MSDGLVVLGDDALVVAVSSRHGARLSSLVVGGRERLVTRRGDPLGWGAFPMVPFAGRLRDAVLAFEGSTHRFPAHADGHAIHGTVLDETWRTVSHDHTSAEFEVDLGEPWPFGGSVTHAIDVDGAAGVVRCRLAVCAGDQSMPAQVGWHPWFDGYDSLQIDFATVLARDARGIPDGTVGVEPAAGTRDDCFTGARTWPVVWWADGWSIRVESSCSHWVVYDVPRDACCVEPQSGAPNDVNARPAVLQPGDSLVHDMVLRLIPPVIGNT